MNFAFSHLDQIVYTGIITEEDIDLGELKDVSMQENNSKPTLALGQPPKDIQTAKVRKSRSPKKQTSAKTTRSPRRLE